MIRRGGGDETLVLRKKDGQVAASGNAAARFGYKIGSPGSGTADGVWADWTWERGRLRLENDDRGFYPLFYYRDGDGFGTSNDVAALLESGCSAELDDAAIAVFLRLGFYVGDDTPFKAIRALPPGAVLDWDSAGFRLRSAGPRAETDGAPPSRGAAVEEYGRLLRSAVAECAPGDGERIALPLSGGRDSRHILFALLETGRKPAVCVTARRFPPMADEDAAVAAEVARSSGIGHVTLPPVADFLAAEREKNRLTNFCADEHAWLLPVRDYLAANSFAAIFDGIGGDVLSAGLFLNEERLGLYRDGKMRELAEDVLGPEHYLPKMLPPELRARWSRERALARVVPELERHRGRPNPVGQFYFWNRTRREIAASPWRLLNASCAALAPYLSGAVYSFLASLPASYFLDHAFHTETIARRYPERAHLPYETRRLPPTRVARARVAAYAWSAARYCLFPAGSRKRVNASFYLPRIAKGLVDAAYGANLHNLFDKAVYLTQLEKLAADPAS
jgi:asparagine synthase (glutamine-hydrolysing)